MAEMQIKKDIQKFMNSTSYMDLDGEIEKDYLDDNNLLYATRSHGDVGEEEPGSEDFKHAYEIRKKLYELFPNDIQNVEIEDVDEWVHLTIILF